MRRSAALVLLAGALGLVGVAGEPIVVAPGEDVQVLGILDVQDVEDADEGSEGETAFLGVQLEEETEHPEGGARITEVVSGSPAEKVGLREGDIVVRFDGHVIRGPVALTERIHGRKPEDRVSITIARGKKEQTLEVELGQRSAEWTVLAPHASGGPAVAWGYRKEDLDQQLQQLKERMGDLRVLPTPDAQVYAPLRHFALWGKPRLGVQLVNTTPELRRHLGGDDDSGVLVSKVLTGTPAERAGVRVGDLIVAVDGDEIETAEDLVEALEDKEGGTIEVRLIRDRRSVSLEVRLEQPEEEEPTGPRASLAPPPPPELPRRPPMPPPPPAAPAPPARVSPPTPPPAPPTPPAPPAPPRRRGELV